MAELALSRAGLAAAGRAIGSLAVDWIGQSLSPPVEGSRVEEFHLTDGREGAGIPIVYGRMRVGAQLIWATEFKERREVEGGKGGPRVAEYSYSLSFAVALCEGEISGVTRCWANGEPFDLSKVTWRLYKGTEDQAPDPLIEAVEAQAPGYRGVAYIVFEDMPVDQFGARMPHMSFEVVRPAGGSDGRLENIVRAVNMIPGSGEFALSTDIVRRRIGPGRERAENLHGPEAKSDFEASLDQLEAQLPEVTRVNLVVAWFGSDLRCGDCEIRPGVETAGKTTVPYAWSVAGIGRNDAYVVSATGGRPNYGGTPSDTSVRHAISALKARGFHVTLYPFLLLDIPTGNGLPDPYGGAEQAAFPWRGRITTVAGGASAQIDAFFAGYRSFVLHYAALADETGADGILIGSELVGLTRATDGGTYPAVDALCELAGDVRDIVGSGVEISYAADWTEYGAHVAGDDVSFPLDALWVDDAVTYVGLDWYPPMADWRDGEAHADATFRDGRSHSYLAANVAGGEAFDWYYASDAGRTAQERLPITDGGYGEPWVFRQKDIAGWWENTHHPRTGGTRSVTPTAWVVGMKPVRFVEMGVPAVDKGANQPNVFYDPKSSESALPHFSDGSRDDVIQRRAIEAFHLHWSDDANNPASSEYEGRMVPADGIALWAWDARPFPAFPARDDVWGDVENWRLGHWLNGRIGLALLPDVAADICARVGVACDVSGLTGVVSGYCFKGPVSARSVLEPLVMAHGVDATERGREIVFRMRGTDVVEIGVDRLAEENAPAREKARAGMEGAELRVRLRHVDAEADYESGLAVSAGGTDADVTDIAMPLAMDRGQAQRLADELADEMTRQRERMQFAMAADGVLLEAGDVAQVEGELWRILEVSDGSVIRFEAVREGAKRVPMLTPAIPAAPQTPASPVEPDAAVIDAPPLPGREDDLRPIGFAYAEPWVGAVTFLAGSDATDLTERGRVERPCAMGRLASALYPHVSGRWQDASIWVRLAGATLSSRSDSAVLNGANAALVEAGAGWELLQYREAELVDVETYRLSGLLRGQQGSEPAMAAGASIDSRIVFLTGAETRLNVADWERGLDLHWRSSRGSADDSADWSATQSIGATAGRMWSPAHLAAELLPGGDIQLKWTRRARKGGDSWGQGEPPHELAEIYRIQVLEGGDVIRSQDVTESYFSYLAFLQEADFPVGGAARIEVAQLGPDGEPGAWAGIDVDIPA